jgi:hypothetical protein
MKESDVLKSRNPATPLRFAPVAEFVNKIPDSTKLTFDVVLAPRIARTRV